MRSPGDYRKLFPHGPQSSKNNFFGIKISQRRDWECPSIKNPVWEGYVPKNLVAKILAHVEHGHRGPGSIKNSKVRCPEIQGVNRSRFLFKI